MRSHPPPETPGNSIGLEAIIRKALMGNYEDPSEERSPSNTANATGASASNDGRAEDSFLQGDTSLMTFIHMKVVDTTFLHHSA